MREYTLKENIPYLTNSNPRGLKFGQPPIVVNYFYHKELIKK